MIVKTGCGTDGALHSTNNVLTPPTEDLRGVGVHEAEAGGQEAGAALHLALVTGRSVCGTEVTGDSDTSSGEILKFRVRLILS